MPNPAANRHRQQHGWDHSKARAAAFALLPEYPWCVRGGHVMWKWAKDKHGKSALHYDHNDSGTGYLGFSCALHNLGTAPTNGTLNGEADATGHAGRSRTRPQTAAQASDGESECRGLLNHEVR
jgi:hypothetical protein